MRPPNNDLRCNGNLQKASQFIGLQDKPRCEEALLNMGVALTIYVVVCLIGGRAIFLFCVCFAWVLASYFSEASMARSRLSSKPYQGLR